MSATTRRGRPPLGDDKRVRIAGVYVTSTTAAQLDAICSFEKVTRGRVAGRILDALTDVEKKKDR